MKFVRKMLSVVLRYSPSEKLSDIILWPLSRRLFKNYSEVVSIEKDLKIKVYGDMEDMVNKLILFTSSYMPLAWEPGTARLVRKLAPKSRSSVVAGSHIGYYPLILASSNSSATINAFEPNPLNKERLEENISLNNFKNIQTSSYALGNKIGEEKMYFDFGQSSFIDSSRAHAGEGMVKLTTLDEFFKNKNQKPDLIILDAEGFEPYILEGGKEIISKNHPEIIFELNPKALEGAKSSAQALKDLLSQEGYKLFVIDEGKHGIVYDRNFPVKLVPFDEFSFANVSFVNIFATIHSENIPTYVDQA